MGGVREKILAAHRAGVKTVIIPARNMKDLVDVPKKARDDLNIIPVEHVDKVLDVALCPPEKETRNRALESSPKTRKEPPAN